MRSLLMDVQDKPEVKRKPLGEKEIGGHRVVGFRVSYSSGQYAGVVMNLWGDPKTGLPSCVETIIHSSGKVDKVTMSDFKFDVALDESLFSTEPPAGYTTINLQWNFPPAAEKDLIETLRQYASDGGNTFPDVLDLADAGRFGFAFGGRGTGPKPTDQEMQKRIQDAIDAHVKHTLGFRFILDLPPEANWHYAGKGVSLGAADKPIFWYRPKDATKCRVIYGDLSVKELAPEEVKELPEVKLQ